MAGLGYFGLLLQQNPQLAQNPAFLAALENGGAGALGTHTPAPAPSYSTSNNPTNVDPTTVTGNAQQIASLAPAPIQDFGNIAQVAPTYAQAATVDPNQTQSYLNQYENVTNQSLQPYFQQQQMQLQEADAARGIQNTGAAGYLQGNLLGQQGATLAGQFAPLVQRSYGYQQDDIAANQANAQSANQFNATQANQAAGTNAGYYNQALVANYNAYNNYLNQLYGSGSNEQNSLLAAYLNSFGANTGVTNAMSQGLAGTQNAYNNVFNQASQNQQNTIGNAALALGGA